MAYTITSQCIGCDRCFDVCPTDAIQIIDQYPQIDPERCNDCVGFYSIPYCWSVCPTNAACIPGATTTFTQPVLRTTDYWERWFTTYNRMRSKLHQTKHSEYWEQWFDTYSQKVSHLIQTRILDSATITVSQ